MTDFRIGKVRYEAELDTATAKTEADQLGTSIRQAGDETTAAFGDKAARNFDALHGKLRLTSALTRESTLVVGELSDKFKDFGPEGSVVRNIGMLGAGITRFFATALDDPGLQLAIAAAGTKAGSIYAAAAAVPGNLLAGLELIWGAAAAAPGITGKITAAATATGQLYGATFTGAALAASPVLALLVAQQVSGAADKFIFGGASANAIDTIRTRATKGPDGKGAAADFWQTFAFDGRQDMDKALSDPQLALAFANGFQNATEYAAQQTAFNFVRVFHTQWGDLVAKGSGPTIEAATTAVAADYGRQLAEKMPSDLFQDHGDRIIRNAAAVGTKAATATAQAYESQLQMELRRTGGSGTATQLAEQQLMRQLSASAGVGTVPGR